MAKKIKESDLRRGVRLKTDSLDQEVPETFREIELVSTPEMEHWLVRSLKTGQEGIWWNKFIVNRGYYKIE